MEQRSTQGFGNNFSTAILIGSNSFRKCTKFSVLNKLPGNVPFLSVLPQILWDKKWEFPIYTCLLGTCFMHRCLQAKRVSYPPGL